MRLIRKWAETPQITELTAYKRGEAPTSTLMHFMENLSTLVERASPWEGLVLGSVRSGIYRSFNDLMEPYVDNGRMTPEEVDSIKEDIISGVKTIQKVNLRLRGMSIRLAAFTAPWDPNISIYSMSCTPNTVSLAEDGSAEISKGSDSGSRDDLLTLRNGTAPNWEEGIHSLLSQRSTYLKSFMDGDDGHDLDSLAWQVGGRRGQVHSRRELSNLNDSQRKEVCSILDTIGTVLASLKLNDDTTSAITTQSKRSEPSSAGPSRFVSERTINVLMSAAERSCFLTASRNDSSHHNPIVRTRTSPRSRDTHLRFKFMDDAISRAST